MQYQALAEPLVTIAPSESLTLDKWKGNDHMPRSKKYVAAAFVTASFFVNTFPAPAETVTVDKWHVGTPHRIVKRLPRVIPYGTAFGGEAERSTMDKWFNQTSQPIFKKTLPRALYPSFFFDPKPIPGVGETVTVDKWYRNTNIPPKRAPKKVVITTINFRAEAEQTQLDKWFRQTSQPLFRKRLPTALYPASFLDPKPIAGAVETVTADKWLGSKPDKLNVRARNQYLYPSFFVDSTQLTQGERITIDKWYFPSQIPKSKKPWPITYGAYVRVEEAAAETVTLDKWYKKFDLPPKGRINRTYQYPSGFFDPNPIAGVAETVTLDKWFNQTSQRLYGRALPVKLIPYFFHDGKHFTTGETITLDKWFRETSQRVNRKRYPVFAPELAFTHPAISAVETVTLDKWYRPLSKTYDRKRVQFMYPTWFGFAEEPSEGVSVDTWFRNTSTPRFDRKRYLFQYPYFVIDLAQLTQAERLTMDKWFVETQRPPKRARRVVVFAPFSTDITIPIPPTFVALDRYYQELQRPPKGRRPEVFTYPTLSWDTVTPPEERLKIALGGQEPRKGFLTDEQRQGLLREKPRSMVGPARSSRYL